MKGQREIIIVPEDDGEPREYSLTRGVHVNVQEGDRVGGRAVDGRAEQPARYSRGPRRAFCARWGGVLSVLGEKTLHAHLVNEIQEVYRLQGVNINDKHISRRVGPHPHAHARAFALA